MKVKLLGKRPVNMVNKETGEVVTGVSLHCVFRDPDVVGEAVDKFFCNDRLGVRDMIDGVSPGVMLNLDFYKKRLIEVSILESKK